MALAMMRMIKPPGRIEGGQVIVGDTDLTGQVALAIVENVTQAADRGSPTFRHDTRPGRIKEATGQRAVGPSRAVARVTDDANGAAIVVAQ